MIEVTNLSSTTETESFRVDGLGTARLLVVQCTLDRRPEIPKSDPIRDLKSELHELRTEKSAREQEVKILKDFGKSMADNSQVTPDQARTFSDALYGKIIACAETVRDLDEEITRLTQRINKMQTSKVGEAFTKAIITILADEDGSAHLKLIYREENGAELRRNLAHQLRAGVLNARWNPLYDLYATSEDGKPSTSVSLHYRVNLSQNTGEDWTSAKLVLSTSATDILNAGIPRPDNLVIELPSPPSTPGSLRRSRSPTPASLRSSRSSRSPQRRRIVYRSYNPRTRSLSPTQASTEGSVQEMGFTGFAGGGAMPSVPPPMVLLPQLVQSAAVISKSPITVSYTVEALTTIPSDGLSHKVLVATIPFEAIITHVTSPRKSPIAYLQVWKTMLLGVLSWHADSSTVRR